MILKKQTWSEVGLPVELDDAGPLAHHQHPLPQAHLGAPTHRAAGRRGSAPSTWEGNQYHSCSGNPTWGKTLECNHRPAEPRATLSGEQRRPGEVLGLGPGETRCLRGLAGTRCLGRGVGRAPSSDEDEEERERDRTPVLRGERTSEGWEQTKQKKKRRKSIGV